MAKKYISQIATPDGSTYYIKDEEARTMLSHGLEIVVETTLPDASEGTMGKLYMILDSSGHDPSQGSGWKDIYDEYVTVKTGNTYSWEKIGNTDVNLSAYSKKTHTHTVTLGVASHSYTPAGGVAINASAVSNVKPATGTGTYKPSGTISASFTGSAATLSLSGTASGTASGTIDSSGAHTHGLYSSKQYLQTTKFIKAGGLSTKRLITTNATCVSTGTTTAQKSNIAANTSVYIPNSSSCSVKQVTTNTTGSVTVYKTNASCAKSTLGSTKTTTHASNDSTSVMWDTSVVGETLSFVFKPLQSQDAVIDATASTTATVTSTSDYSFTGINGSTALKFTDVTVPIKLTNNSTSILSVSTGTTGEVFVTGVAADGSANAFSNVNGTSSSYPIITAVGADTSSAGAHTHSGSLTFSGATVSVSGSYTPAGTVNATFDGSNTRLVTETKIPSTFTFSGTAATLSHSVQTTGTTLTTSAASE
jgi:hypothetical protein